MSGSRLGLLALGESPRRDAEETLTTVLGRTVPVVHAGALDGFSPRQRELLTTSTDGSGIETSLADGTPVEVSKARLVPLLQEAVRTRLASASSTVLLCSGEFTELRRLCPEVLQPAVLLREVVRATGGGKVLGVVGPRSDVPGMRASWGGCAADVVPVGCSPHEGTVAIIAGAVQAHQRGAELLLLDCIGFTEAQRRAVHEETGLPTIAPMTLVARLVPDLLLIPAESRDDPRARTGEPRDEQLECAT